MKKSPAIFLILFFAFSFSCKNDQTEVYQKGIKVKEKEGTLLVMPVNERIIHVRYTPEADSEYTKSLMVSEKLSSPKDVQIKKSPGITSLYTRSLKVNVSTSDGTVSFHNLEDEAILREKKNGGRICIADTMQGKKTYTVQQLFYADEDEAYYGLGQHQNGYFNYRGIDVDLWQDNIVAVVPFLISSKGYGILWDNYSRTKFGDPREFQDIPSLNLLDEIGNPGGLTGYYYQGSDFDQLLGSKKDSVIHFDFDLQEKDQSFNAELLPKSPYSIKWTGKLNVEKSGSYLIRIYNNADISIRINDEPLIVSRRQSWLPWYDIKRVKLNKNDHYKIEIEWKNRSSKGVCQLQWKLLPEDYDQYASLWSKAGQGIDYYFIYGPSMDSIISGYRELTGPAPMMPKWAMGLWQCKERYKSQEEILNVVKEYRERKIPLDNIVQDWFYWEEDQWGSHQFDPARFPNPDQMIRDIHEKYNMHYMISVWPKFYTNTDHFKAFQEQGWIYEHHFNQQVKDWVGYEYTYYDAYAEKARDLYWKQINENLFSKGVDAWWLDATEPELTSLSMPEQREDDMNPNALGTGVEYLNPYSLAHSKGIYENQMKTAPDKRVFILTRSAFAGQQKYSAATWSGDIYADWGVLKKQIASGLNFSLSGIPYWTTDIGGFVVDFANPTANEEWFELFTRWFQFGTFCPIFRVHGSSTPREMWYFGGRDHNAYLTQLKFDRLRYHIMPYIYSLTAKVTFENYTIMRPLIMDFPEDKEVLNISDQFMFGPNLMVCPVTTFMARNRKVYLPENTLWYDFWEGKQIKGGQEMLADAPYFSIPVFVKAGSIMLIGPELQYSDEKPADPVLVCIYGGANGEFTLYEDENINNQYKKGIYAQIKFSWNDEQMELTIHNRKGKFPGMLEKRRFDLDYISPDSPSGYDIGFEMHKSVEYDGSEIVISMR